MRLSYAAVMLIVTFGVASSVSGQCADGSHDRPFELGEKVVGCRGAFRAPGVRTLSAPSCDRGAGNTGSNASGEGCNAADLCAAGWHVCRLGDEAGYDDRDFREWCVGSGLPFNGFFVSRASGEDVGTCDLDRKNGSGLIGCGQGELLTPPSGCTPLLRSSGEQCEEIFGFECPDSGTEAFDVTKNAIGLGGVLCCVNTDEACDCLEGELCARDGDVHPGDSCMVCDRARGAFVPRDGEACMEGSMPGTCRSSGVRGVCCTGCWDGRDCFSGTTATQCGSGGRDCDQCVAGNACQEARCDAGECQERNRPNGTACNDGDRCTEDDDCRNGRCRGSARDCDDGLSCTSDECDPATGMCERSLNPGGCLVGGACFAAGDPNPAESCEVCRPSQSTTSFSSTAACGDCDEDSDCPPSSPVCEESTATCFGCLVDGDCAGGVCTAGRRCATCEDSPDEPVDSGCTAALPNCIGMGARCVECLGDGQCGAGEVCRPDNTCEAVAACMDDSSEGIDSGCDDSSPFCQDGACLECELRDGTSLGCPISEPACLDGTCVECATSADCAAGARCEDNRCTTNCAGDDDCSPTQPRCGAEGLCVECLSADDCPAGMCVGGGCAECAADSDCAEGAVCVMGACSACRSDDECDEGRCVDGSCAAECTDGTECADAMECIAGRCERAATECTGDSQCEENEECIDFRCQPCGDDGCTPGCRDERDCPPGATCDESGRCIGECMDDGDCEPGFSCSSGRCARPAEGCTSDSECRGGRCVDNVCRDDGPGMCTGDPDCGPSAPLCEEGVCVVCRANDNRACSGAEDGLVCIGEGASARCGCESYLDCAGRICDEETSLCVDGTAPDFGDSEGEGCSVGRGRSSSLGFFIIAGALIVVARRRRSI